MIAVSIHAPARGATRTDGLLCLGGSSFNPRAREGRDIQDCRTSPMDLPVSIHAPARGATRVIDRPRSAFGVSIHAPARGATSDGRCRVTGCDRFNPRAREGRDLGQIVAQPTGAVFQSTRPRGARREMMGRFSLPQTVSIHAPARGATRLRAQDRGEGMSFNPRAREGRDDCALHYALHDILFQSTRPRGARPNVVLSQYDAQ